jgi:hypothetical protein
MSDFQNPVENPWKQVTSENRVLEKDKEIVEAFNRKYSNKPNFILQKQLLPEPFIGDPQSPVYLLGLNPGYSKGDDERHVNPIFIERLLANLRHEIHTCPFYYLDRRETFANSPGAMWWRRKCKWLIEEVGEEHLARNIFCVEYFPYHSKNYKDLPKAISPTKNVLSVNYSIFLVRKAINEGKVIVAMRKSKDWVQLVPELETYPNLISLFNHRNVVLSPGNMKHWKKLIKFFG